MERRAWAEEIDRPGRSGRGPQTPPQVTITALPASANALLLYEAALRVGVPDEYRTRHLEHIRAAAARHGDDAYARRVRAHAEIMLGDRAAAAPLLDALLAAAPAEASSCISRV